MAKQRPLDRNKSLTWTIIGIRTIHFEVSESLQQYSSNKKTVTVVQLTLYYKQDDYRISEPLWDKAKADVEKAISKNDGIFDGPIELPV